MKIFLRVYEINSTGSVQVIRIEINRNNQVYLEITKEGNEKIKIN